MDASEFADRMRTEHLHVGALADQLRKKVAVVPKADSPAWIKDVTDCLEHFRAHMQKHMAMEEEHGYLHLVVERRPILSERVDRLGREHAQLATIMNDLYSAFCSLESDQFLSMSDCCRRVEHLLAMIERHEEAENLLVLSVFTQDVGATD